MFSKFFGKKKKSRSDDQAMFTHREKENTPDDPPLSYNWIITNKLAIGPMPKTINHWKQLEFDGFLSRFSCCYPYENVFTPIPRTWNSTEVSLPDHREQEPLDKLKLIHALKEAEGMILNHPDALYLHCFAGQERSALMAIGLVCILEKKDLFDSIAFVRQCHKRAKPLYSQLDLLEQVLKEGLE
jgi:hypothetical protein